jgi:hypothetical protein
MVKYGILCCKTTHHTGRSFLKEKGLKLKPGGGHYLSTGRQYRILDFFTLIRHPKNIASNKAKENSDPIGSGFKVRLGPEWLTTPEPNTDD